MEKDFHARGDHRGKGDQHLLLRCCSLKSDLALPDPADYIPRSYSSNDFLAGKEFAVQALTRWFFLGGLMVALVSSGCGSKVDPSTSGKKEPASGHAVGAVAIIDLDVIAKQLGSDKEMSVSIQQREASLNQQLAAVRDSYNKQISEKQGEFGANPTPEQAQHLADMQRQVNANLNQVLQRAKNDLNQHSARVIQHFRNEIKPVAREVATEKGLSIIVTKNDSVIFDYDRAVDITDEVVRRMLAQNSNPSATAQTPPAADTPTVASQPNSERSEY